MLFLVIPNRLFGGTVVHITYLLMGSGAFGFDTQAVSSQSKAGSQLWLAVEYEYFLWRCGVSLDKLSDLIADPT